MYGALLEAGQTQHVAPGTGANVNVSAADGVARGRGKGGAQTDLL